MSIHEKIDTSNAAPVDATAVIAGAYDAQPRPSLRDAPGYSAFFGLSDDKIWNVFGKIAAAFLGVVTIGTLGAIAVAVAS